MKAIIVDDESAVSDIITYFIKKEQLPINIVGVAKNGVEALKIIKENEVQLVFLDIRMPLMDGFEVMENVPEKNFIIITAYDTFKYAQRALRLGARDILLKPIDHNKLIESITRVVDWKFTDNDTLNQMLKYIDENYYKPLDLPHLSDKFFISPTHISRLFKKHLKQSTICYIHEVRIKKSLKLLKKREMSIKEVAEKVGYNSLNNFYKHFNSNMGLTPAEYIQGKEIKIIDYVRIDK